MKKRVNIFFVLFVGLLLVSCTPAVASPAAATAAPDIEPVAAAAKPEEIQNLSVMTHDSFAASEGIIAGFEQANDVKITFLKSGDTGAAVNRAALSKNSPLADVLYGVDSSFLSRALQEGIFEPFDSPSLAAIPAAYRLDPENRALPVDYGDVCINYDKAYFEENQLPLPQSLADLTLPEYKGLLVVENPVVSSPGLSFLLATIAEYGQDGYLKYWKQLRDNEVVVVNNWETAYYTNFSGSSGKGLQPLVVSYASSPVAEVVFASQPLTDSPTGSLVGKNMCYRQIEFVGILKGTGKRALAEKFVNFMLDKPFQEDMPLQMFVYPVNPDAQLPESFVKYAQTPVEPATMDATLIALNREKWMEDWTRIVLK